jgi:hypothetical protein
MKANNFNVMRAWWSVDGKHGKWQKYASGILEVVCWINSAGPYLRREYRFL